MPEWRYYFFKRRLQREIAHFFREKKTKESERTAGRLRMLPWHKEEVVA